MKLHLWFLLLTALLVSCESNINGPITCYFVYPVTDQYISNNATISLEVKVSDAVQSITFLFDDEPIGTVTSMPYFINWTPVGIHGGNHVITARILTLENKTVISSVNVFFSYHIGELNQGGKVYFIDDTDHHGLVVALEDFTFQSDTSFFWGPEQFIGANDSLDGAGNTQMLASNDYMEDYPWIAFKLGYTFNGFSDWYVPSKTEMLLLTDHLKELDGTAMNIMSGIYWTSTECCRSKAYAVDMESYDAVSMLKLETSYKIRPIRKF